MFKLSSVLLQSFIIIIIIVLAGMSPLHLAAWSGKVEIARLLVESGAQVDSCSEN